MNIAEWITAAGEFAIALVIILEMEENRRDRFLSEAADVKNYEDRGRLYAAFYDTAGDTVESKSEEFCRQIWKSGQDKSELKRSCERQIVLFGRLAQIKSRAWFYRRDYVELFPHAVVTHWIMVAPYIKERRTMTGEWWASDFESLTRVCLRFLLRHNRHAKLTLYDNNRDRRKDFVIPNKCLLQLRDQLKSRKPKLKSV